MERIDRAVERELARGSGGAPAALGAITTAWAEIVGAGVARNAWPARIGRDGTLHVATTTSTWAFELDRLGPEMLEKLAARLGEEAPAKLRFAVGPVPEPAAPEALAGPTAPPEATPEVAAEAARAASEIADTGLRDLALRAARASLSKPPSDRCF